MVARCFPKAEVVGSTPTVGSHWEAIIIFVLAFTFVIDIFAFDTSPEFSFMKHLNKSSE
jgi:hypothetical protein